jgi:hypothetical protein
MMVSTPPWRKAYQTMTINLAIIGRLPTLSRITFSIYQPTNSMNLEKLVKAYGESEKKDKLKR